MNSSSHGTSEREVRIPSGDARLYGDLCLPPRFTGIVLFAHGSGSGRHSARNRQVANHLQEQGIATLLFDLLTAQEEQVDLHTREHRFDIPLLTRRMQDATAWAWSQPELQNTPVGYFGASTGSAAALIAAARLGERIAAVVSRGGLPDLAGPAAPAAAMRKTARHRAWSDPPVRGARRPGTGGADRGVLVQRPPGACGASGMIAAQNRFKQDRAPSGGSAAAWAANVGAP